MASEPMKRAKNLPSVEPAQVAARLEFPARLRAAMLDMMASEPKRASEFRTSGDTNPGLGQHKVIEVEVAPTHGGKENELGAVLAASTRAGASLSALYRAIQQVTDGVTDARQANEHLTQELSRVREMLGASNEERLALKNQVAILEQELEQLRAASVSEREFLISEQDNFLVGLLEEHDQQLARLIRERETAQSELAEVLRSSSHTQPVRKPGREALEEEGAAQLLNRIDKLTQEQEASRGTLRRLQAQRDGAHEQIKKLEQSLADARQEAATLRASGVTAPPDDPRRTQPACPETPNGRVPISADGEKRRKEGVAEQSAGQPAKSSDRPTLDAVMTQRATVPPAPNELAQALVESRPSPPQGTRKATSPEVPRAVSEPEPTRTPSKRPPLKRKPDPAQQPLGGYSVSGEDVEAETVVSSKPPRT